MPLVDHSGLARPVSLIGREYTRAIGEQSPQTVRHGWSPLPEGGVR